MQSQTLAAGAAATEVDIDEHLPLVDHALRHISARLPRHADREDLWGAGALGLVDAARKWDPSYNVPFGTYAMRRIHGSILDATRTVDWASRGARREIRELANGEHKLEQELGRGPSDLELADELGVSVDDVVRRRHAAVKASVLHLDHPTGDEESGGSLGALLADNGVTPSSAAEAKELVGSLRLALDHLPELYREVLVRHYFDGELFCDIAAEKGVTEARVSQIRGEAVNALRAWFADAYEGVPEVAENAPGVRRRASYVAQMRSMATWSDRMAAGDQNYRTA